LDDKSKEEDIVIESNGINLFMDKQLEFYLDGAEIDYIKTAQGAGFIIKNLRAGPTCSSCGSSCDSH
jgi:iron-sulfur cluster assembly accessory protein